MLERPRRTRRLTLTEQVLESLGQAIVSGKFEAGNFPTEAEISRLFSTSRSVTREAVKMLTAKGMLTARPRSGIIAQPQECWSLLDPDVLRWMLEKKFSHDLLRHFTEMRLGLEPEAAALAAKQATPRALQAIEQGLQRMVDAENGDDDHLEADVAFHVSVLRATGNPFYAQLDELITTALKISIRQTNRIKGHTASVSAHRRVFNAIKAGNAARASAAMKAIVQEASLLIAADQARDVPAKKARSKASSVPAKRARRPASATR
ncbi:FadR family transcriptional regulator [Dyella telluris]|uniref:FadR family transcriptional regulator n=2 Tax=Dyella telluris TaxID=2763498 RepID=A0A7G8QAW5_9GAMM|nr:FadR family transcriptional regulator [Dyella telluris]